MTTMPHRPRVAASPSAAGPDHASSREERLAATFEAAFRTSSAVLVSGGFGSGKTTDVLRFARRAALRTMHMDLSGCVTAAEVERAVGAARAVGADHVAPTTWRMVETVPAADQAGLLIVFDDADETLASLAARERLTRVISSRFVHARIFLIVHEEPGDRLIRSVLEGRLTHVGEEELVLTEDEAVELLADWGIGAAPAIEAHALTHGWLMGTVLVARFGAGSVHVEDYLRQVLGSLAEDERALLLDIAVLGEAPTVEDVCVVGGRSAATALQRLRRKRPAGTKPAGRSVVLSPLFAQFLCDEVIGAQPDRVRDARAALAMQHPPGGEPMSAAREITELREYGLAAEARARLVPRSNGNESWSATHALVSALARDVADGHPELAAAELRSLFKAHDYHALRGRVERLHTAGDLQSVLRHDPPLLALIGAALRDEPHAALRLMMSYEGDYHADGVRYMLEATTSEEPVVHPHGLAWTDGYGLATWALMMEGQLDAIPHLVDENDDPLFVSRSHRVLALLWQGDHEGASALWAQVPATIRGGAHHCFVQGMVDLFFGRHAEALDSFERGIASSQRTALNREEIFEIFVGYCLAIRANTERAELLLRKLVDGLLETHQIGAAEWAQAFHGLTLLLADRDEEAEQTLELCTRSMERSRRMLLLPFAAICLAEARHRRGNDRAAFDAAQRGYSAAERMGSFYWLVTALRHFPDVRARQLATDSPNLGWRRLSIRAHSVGPEVMTSAASNAGTLVEVSTFGSEPGLCIDGSTVDCRRMKVVELLAYLALHPQGVDRQDLQRALFPEADQRSGGNHFRQISHKLREITGLSLARSETTVQLSGDIVLITTDIVVERLTAAASLATGVERRRLLSQAVRTADGPYLLRSTLEWAEERRYALQDAVESACAELAVICLEACDYGEASRYAEAVVAADPFNEAMHRVILRCERVLGSEASLRAAQRRAQRVLAQIRV